MSHAPTPDAVPPQTAHTTANGGLFGFLLRISPILLLTPAAVQMISILQMICTQYVNIPNWDDWDLYPVLAGWRDGHLNLADIFAIHNGHRIVFTRLIFIANEALFHGTRLPVLLLSFLIQIGTLAILTMGILRLRLKPIPAATAVAVTAFLLFSLTASETWLWSFLIQHTLALMFFCLAVFMLPREPSAGGAVWRTAAACCFGACATYTSGNAIIALPAVLTLSLAYRLPHRFSWGIFAVSVLTIVPYFVNYHGDPARPDRIVTIADRLQYIFAFLGGPFGLVNIELAVVMGVLIFAGVLVYAWIAFERQKRTGDTQMLPWLTLTLLPLFTAAGGAVDRVAYGVDQSLSSRYMTTSVLTWIAVAVCTLYLLPSRQEGSGEIKEPAAGRRYASYAAITAVLGILGYLHGVTGNQYLHDLSAFGDRRAVAADALRKGDRSDAVLLTLYSDRDRLLELISKYQEKHLFPFEQP